MQVFNPSSGIWKDAEAMSMMRSRVGVAVLNCRLYAIGGYNGVERLNTVEEFDSDKKVWRRVAPMNCKRRCASTKSFLRGMGVSSLIESE